MSGSWLFSCCEQTNTQKQMAYDDSKINIQLQKSLCMNIKNSNYEQIVSQCQKKKRMFTDQMFPPSDKSLGEFKKIPRRLVWKRITDILDNPCVYSHKNHPADSILTVASSGSYMKTALVSLALKPQKIYSIFDYQKQINNFGVYKVRVKLKGVLQWMIVDDYIPVFQDTDRPLLCGTINDQIWVMLIFKAWAKICGSYSAIQGEDCFSVLNTFSTGPCFSYLLYPSVRQDKQFIHEITEFFNANNSICVTTTGNPKLKLKPDYDYVLRRYRNGTVELVGQGIDQKVSHKVALDDLFLNFVELNVSKFEKNCINSEECELILRYNQPFFLKYELFQPFLLTFGIWKDGKDNLQNFIRIVVARKIGTDKYQYVSSKLEAFYQSMYLQCPEVHSGTYYIMLMINGPTDFNADVKFVCYKRLKGQLTNIYFQPCLPQQVHFQSFLSSTLSSFSENARRSTIRQMNNSGSMLQYDELYRKGGFGYVRIKAGNLPNFSYLKVKINKIQIKKSKYELISNVGEQIKIHPQTEKTLVFLLRCMPNQEKVQSSFPPGISVMEIF